MKPHPRYRWLLLGLLLVLAAGWGHLRAQGRINYAEWQLELAEEFNQRTDTTDLAARWMFYYPWGRALNNSLEDSYYTSEALRPGPGVLDMTVTRRATSRQYRGRPLNYDASMLISRHAHDLLAPVGCQPSLGYSYGLFEVRVRQPRRANVPAAFWLWGGAFDEIDVFEADAHSFSTNVHLGPHRYWRPTRREEQTSQCYFYNIDPRADLSQEFHTYGVSWLPDGAVFYYDGIPIRHETRLLPAGCPMYLILGCGALAYTAARNDTLVVDYLRVYRPRHLVPPVAVLRPSGQAPTSELNWLPFEAAPNRPDQATYQVWELGRARRAPHRLTLLLADNHNPDPGLPLPLPLNGRWAPAWVQTHGTPELRVRPATLPDSLHWALHDLYGRPVAAGAAAAAATWQPRWPTVPPGLYALHLRQGPAAATQPVVMVGRPAGSGPTAEWQRPAPPPPADF